MWWMCDADVTRQTECHHSDDMVSSVDNPSKQLVYVFFIFFFFNDTATTEIYTLSLHDALPISYACNDPKIQNIAGKNDQLSLWRTTIFSFIYFWSNCKCDLWVKHKRYGRERKSLEYNLSITGHVTFIAWRLNRPFSLQMIWSQCIRSFIHWLRNVSWFKAH